MIFQKIEKQIRNFQSPYLRYVNQNITYNSQEKIGFYYFSNQEERFIKWKIVYSFFIDKITISISEMNMEESRGYLPLHNIYHWELEEKKELVRLYELLYKTCEDHIVADPKKRLGYLFDKSRYIRGANRMITIQKDIQQKTT